MKKNTLVATLIMTLVVSNTCVANADIRYAESRMPRFTAGVEAVENVRVMPRLTAGVEYFLSQKPEEKPAASINEKMVASLIENDIDEEQAIGMTVMYEKLKSDGSIPMPIIKGLMCQVAAEGCPGQFESCGKNSSSTSYQHWHSNKVSSSQRQLAGTSIKTLSDIQKGSEIHKDAAIGCGMMQWTKTRREQLFNKYKDIVTYDITPYELAKVETDFVYEELHTPYFKRIFKWAKGKSEASVCDVCTYLYAGQTSSEEKAARREYLKVVNKAIAQDC